MIRPARREDIPALVEMGHAFFAMSPYASVTTYDPGSLQATLEALLTGGLILVSTHGEDITAAIVGVIHPLYFNQTCRVANEIAWFVRPEARGGAEALKLVKHFEAWAKQQGASIVCMSSLETNRRMEGIYERLGYRPAEHSHMKEL